MHASSRREGIVQPSAPSSEFCHGQDLLERQPPVEVAGQGVIKGQRGAFGVLTGGQVRRCGVCMRVCQSECVC